MDGTDIKAWHIASYPRSGNHLVRTLIEYAAQRPTLGCPGAARDTPIHTRPANQGAGLIKIVSDTPIGLKSHFVGQIQKHGVAHDPKGFVLITRDPVAAISSQLGREFSKSYLVTSRRMRRAIEQELDVYLALLYAYRAQPKQGRFHARFEELTAAEGSLEAANAVLGAVVPNRAAISGDEWDAIRKIAKSSQVSLSAKEQSRRNEVRDKLVEIISGHDIQRFIETGDWA